MTNLKPFLDESGKVTRTQKLFEITGEIINLKTKQKMDIKMVNCQFGGSKFKLYSLTKVTNSCWKMSGDHTGIYLSKGKKSIHFNIHMNNYSREKNLGCPNQKENQNQNKWTGTEPGKPQDEH